MEKIEARSMPLMVTSMVQACNLPLEDLKELHDALTRMLEQEGNHENDT